MTHLESKVSLIKDCFDDDVNVELKKNYDPSCIVISFPDEPYSSMVIPRQEINRFMSLVGV